jgi:hypothetical protein
MVDNNLSDEVSSELKKPDSWVDRFKSFHSNSLLSGVLGISPNQKQ